MIFFKLKGLHSFLFIDESWGTDSLIYSFGGGAWNLK